MDVSLVLERGSDGYLAWVVELPGCFTRAAARDAALAKVPAEVRDFLGWLREAGEKVTADDVAIVSVEEVSTGAQPSDGDTEILLQADRVPLTPDDWQRLERWLLQSRSYFVTYSAVSMPMASRTSRGARLARSAKRWCTSRSSSSCTWPGRSTTAQRRGWMRSWAGRGA